MNPQPGPGCVRTPVKLLSCPEQGQEATVRVLGPARGLVTHWKPGKPGRPLACPGARVCPPSNHRLSSCWKAYAPAEVWRDAPYRDWTPVILEITERMWEGMQTYTLRGTVWTIFRQIGEHKRLECAAALVDVVEPAELRTDVSVEPVVTRIYRTAEIEWDVLPYLPARQLLTSSFGAPPPTAKSTPKAELTPGTPEFAAQQAENNRLIRAAIEQGRAQFQRRKGGES